VRFEPGFALDLQASDLHVCGYVCKTAGQSMCEAPTFTIRGAKAGSAAASCTPSDLRFCSGSCRRAESGNFDRIDGKDGGPASRYPGSSNDHACGSS
jgi:hypothetical protein